MQLHRPMVIHERGCDEHVPKNQSSAKSVMFVVNFDDDRTAYLWIDTPAKANDNRVVSSIARAQQEQGTLPEGNITSIKRVR